MGRIGISYIEVAKAATELVGKGVNPTVDAVRELLGTGSKSTIGPYLKQWRVQEGQGIGGSGNGAAGLPSELTSLVKGLYERLQSEADLKIEEVVQDTQSELADMQKALTESNTQKAILEKELQDLKIKLQEALEMGSQYKMELEKESRTVLSLTTKTEEQEHRVKDKEQQELVLEKQLTNAQSNLEHYRESVRAQREEGKRSHEREVRLLQQQTQELQQQVHATAQLNTELKLRNQTLDKAKQQLEKEWYEQKGKTMELQESVKALEAINSRFQKDFNDLNDDYKKIQERLEARTEKSFEFEKEIIVLQERQMLSEKTLNRAEDMVQKLIQEKLFLVQENANLKAECKILTSTLIKQEHVKNA